MNLISIVLDVVLLAILAVSVFLAYKKGFIKTLFSLVGGLIAVILALHLCTPVAAWLNEKFIEPTIRTTVLTAVNGSALAENYDEAINSIDVVDRLQEMPESLRAFLETLNVDVNSIVDSANKVQENSVAVKEKLIDSIVTPVSETLSKAIALIGLILIFFVLLFVASRLLDAVFRLLPFGKKVNKAGGVIFGALRGLLIVLVFGAVVYGLACGNVLVSLEDVENTVLLKLFNSWNPILNALAK